MLPELVERASKLSVNGGFEKNADLFVVQPLPLVFVSHFRRGPLISPAAKQRVTDLITSVEKEHGRILLDGRNVQVPGYANGNFVGPTIVEATVDMTAYREEIFGPVGVVIKFEDEDGKQSTQFSFKL